MKKFVKVLSLVLAISLVAAFVVGCSISGNTYVYDSIKVENASATTESEDYYAGLFQKKVTFSENGSYSIGGTDVGYYKKSGNKIYVGVSGDIDTDTDPLFTLNGDKLILVKTLDDGVKVTVTFKKVA